MYVEHGDILRDLRDWQGAAEVCVEHLWRRNCCGHHLAQNINKINVHLIQSYRIAISLDGSLSRSHLNLAVICHLEGDYKTALHHYLQAHSLDPNNPIIAENISKLKRRLYRQKYYSKACHRDSQLCHVVRWEEQYTKK